MSAGFIKINGYTTEMRLEDTIPHTPDSRLELEKPGTEACYVTLDSQTDINEVETGRLVLCLDIMRDRNQGNHAEYEYVSALVLLLVEESEGFHRRIGFQQCYSVTLKTPSRQT